MVKPLMKKTLPGDLHANDSDRFFHITNDFYFILDHNHTRLDVVPYFNTNNNIFIYTYSPNNILHIIMNVGMKKDYIIV